MSSLDLTASFWQVLLTQESKKYTAFLHRGKTYHFKVVSFRTKVSMAALSRASESVKKGLDFLIDFCDDWAIISKGAEQHLRHLEIIFSIISDAVATVNFDKVIFGRR